MSRITMAAAIATLAGCMVGPDYAPPAVTSPEEYRDAAGDKVASGPVELARWWSTFGDAALDSLVQRSIEANLDLELATARLREARAQAGHSRGALLPEVDRTSGFTHGKASRNGQVPVTGSSVGNLYSTGFDAVWEIDVFGGTRRAIEAADAEYDASFEDRKAVLVSLLGEVVRSYVELRGNQQLAAILRSNVATAKSTVELVRTRLQAGMATELDLARAGTQLANAESLLPETERAIRASIHRLGVLLGREPGALHSELEKEGAIPAPPAKVMVGLPSELVARRPDLRRAERKLAAATARIGVATSDLYPKFSLTGAFGLESVSSADFLKASSKAWSLGPTIRWPIFAGGRIFANIEIEDARAQQALVQYRQSILLAFEEVENAIVAYLREWDERRSLEKASVESRKSVELAGDLYRKGLTSFLDVLEAERTLYDAERRRVESEAAVTLKVVALYKALGGGWEISESN